MRNVQYLHLLRICARPRLLVDLLRLLSHGYQERCMSAKSFFIARGIYFN